MNPNCYLCFVFVCHTVLPVHCSLAVYCWERVHLLGSLLCDVFFFFVTIPYGVLGQVWYLIYPFMIFAFLLTLTQEEALQLQVLWFSTCWRNTLQGTNSFTGPRVGI